MKTSHIKIISIAATVMIIGGGFFYLWRGNKEDGSRASASSIFSFLTGWREESWSGGKGHSVNGENLQIAEQGGEATVGSPSSGYRHPQKLFSLRYPDDLHPVANDLEGSEVIVFDAKQGKGNKGFQIVITPFDEPGPLTAERIKVDIPDLPMEHVQAVSLAGEPALAFYSNDETLGRLLEVWFVYKDDLYQVSGYAPYQQQLLSILGTWRFE